ncbi:SH3 domain-containing protein [Devosia sp. LjRoot3]|uniref:SH3 domain-containing protein n=1 Tax=Devosia sp. LjRoot3 TaxID=3342319 RepID=UPI003ECD7625
MIEVDSGDVMHMRDESFSELLDEINAKTRQLRMSMALFWVASAVGVIGMLAMGGPGLILWAAIALVAVMVGRWLDSYRRTTVLYYELDGDAEFAYRSLAEGFDALSGCAGKWHIEAGGAVQSLTTWKRNAGASHLVRRKATTLAYKLPSVIKSNLTPPSIQVGRQILFFMPDIVLVLDGSRVGAVNYADLNLRWQDSRFIESEAVPRDASIVGQTWQHPNKSGGPDRRFKNNRQIPICLYETMHLTSSSGLNELVEFSRTGVVAGFEQGRRMLSALPRQRLAQAIPAPANDVAARPILEVAERRSPRVGKVLAVVGVVACATLLANVLRPGTTSSTALPLPVVAASSSAPPAVETAPVLNGEPSPAVSLPIEAAVDIDPAGMDLPTDPVPDPSLLRYTTTDVNLRSGPSTQFAVIMVVPEETQVLLVDPGGSWSRVRIDADTDGWMANSTFEAR